MKTNYNTKTFKILITIMALFSVAGFLRPFFKKDSTVSVFTQTVNPTKSNSPEGIISTSTIVENNTENKNSNLLNIKNILSSSGTEIIIPKSEEVNKNSLKTYWFVSNHDYHADVDSIFSETSSPSLSGVNTGVSTPVQLFNDFTALTTFGMTGSCVVSSFCGNTGVSSTDTSGTRQRTIRMFVSNQYVFYAYPTSAGQITNYNNGMGSFRIDGANDSSLTKDIINLKDSSGVVSSYYLYSYQSGGDESASLSRLSTPNGSTSTSFYYGH